MKNIYAFVRHGLNQVYAPLTVPPSARTALTAISLMAFGWALPAKATSEPTGLAGSYLSALHAQATEDSASAAAFLDKALALDPNNRNMIFSAFFQKAQAGDIQGALPYAEAAYADRPSLSVAPLLIAIDHYSKGRFQEANNLIDQISDRSTIGLSLPLIRAWARAPLMPHAEALAALAPYEGESAWRSLAATMSGLLNEYYQRDEAALVYYRALAENIESQPLSVLRLVTNGLHRLGHSDEAIAAVALFREKRGV